MKQNEELLSFSGFMYVRISLKHFRGAVFQRAAESVKELLRSHHGSRAKVYQSNVETFVNDDVLIFYVPVKDVLIPQIEDSGHQLGRDGPPPPPPGLTKTSTLLSYVSPTVCTYLSEDVASQGFIQPWLHVYEFKKVQAISMLLHHHLKVTPILKHLQHLVANELI